MTAFGKGTLKKGLELKTEVTNGTCPLCQEHTVFVSIFNHVYRCITCGADTKQVTNGVIKFMPITSAFSDPKPVLTFLDEDGPEKT